MTAEYEQLLAVLDLDSREGDVFVGPPCRTPFGFVFGGHVIAQAVVAASRTVGDDRPAHSLHLYFIRRGEVDRPISYLVRRVRDGGAFTTRSVDVVQDGVTLAQVLISFHVDMPGFVHQVPAPDVTTSPQELVAVRDGFEQVCGPMREWAGFDIRWGGPMPGEPAPVGAPLLTFARLTGPAPSDPVAARALLGYLSDIVFLASTLLPHGRHLWRPGDARASSLDHALWFHSEPRLDGWLTYEHVSPAAGGSRGLVFGGLYSADGTRIASTAQEGFVRPAP